MHDERMVVRLAADAGAGLECSRTEFVQKGDPY